MNIPAMGPYSSLKLAAATLAQFWESNMCLLQFCNLALVGYQLFSRPKCPILRLPYILKGHPLGWVFFYIPFYDVNDLVGQLGLDRSDSDVGSDTDSASVGIQLAMPLYTGGGVAAATRQAAAQYQAAKDGLEKAMRGATRGVRDAYRGVLSSISSVLALKAGTVSAQSALDATEAGFNVGTRTSVDVLISQRRLFQANRDYSKARYDYIVNTLRLKQAAGTLSEQDLETVNRLLDEGK